MIRTDYIRMTSVLPSEKRLAAHADESGRKLPVSYILFYFF